MRGFISAYASAKKFLARVSSVGVEGKPRFTQRVNDKDNRSRAYSPRQPLVNGLHSPALFSGIARVRAPSNSTSRDYRLQSASPIFQPRAIFLSRDFIDRLCLEDYRAGPISGGATRKLQITIAIAPHARSPALASVILRESRCKIGEREEKYSGEGACFFTALESTDSNCTRIG